MQRRTLLACAAVLAAALGPPPVHAAWPERPLRIIVPFPPGGGVDVLARLVGAKLGPLLGQAVVVDNKPGADTQIGTGAVAQAAPDGYTIGLLTSGFSVNKALYPNLPYDAAKDFTPISGLATSPFYVVAWPQHEAKDLPALIRWGKEHPGKLNYSTSSADAFLAGELLKKLGGIDSVHVRYKGTPPSMMAVMTGEVAYSFFTLTGIKPQVDSGKLRIVGVTSPQRTPQMPQVPTVAEQGMPGYAIVGWFGFIGPAGMPEAVTQKLNAAIQQIIQMPDVRNTIDSLGATPLKQTPEEFNAFLQAEFAKYGTLVKENRLQVD
ncbi:tripartite tricarboxylate transporter substrate binding protein [Ramlibacter sp. G-1-2-2]|uniref:Tripartite tricarboxylate transporter substrate binding protein n=1 Tax=Ramlibacter agri TaxID=2728837 RepID=A0A848H8B9_9BURK|nr:tripartite tricarboxylate transporter substrate binding protein [Ramlibacter agri]NML46754.1 tripartite tricarboxylate transporter substrate binding protein [Ramlibacter agri]